MHNSVFAVLAMGVLVASAYSASPYEPQAKTALPEAAKVHAGQETYEKNCLQCHATHEGQYSFGPNLYGEMKKPNARKSAAEIRVIIKNGKGKMPPFGDKLTKPDVEDLIAYLHTL